MIKCSNCGQVADKPVFISENEKVEQLTGRGTTNLNFKCKNCERKSQMDVLSETYKPWTQEEAAKNDGYVAMIQFDCRGIEVERWDPMNHDQSGIIANAVSSDSDSELSLGTQFEVDFSEGEWSDYDEASDQAVGIYKIESRIGKAK